MKQEYAPKRPFYLQIYQELLAQINQGTYPPGSKLPSEKELAEAYNVSRITSKKAMDTLAADGVISRTPGRGTFKYWDLRTGKARGAPDASVRPRKQADWRDYGEILLQLRRRTDPGH